MLCEAAIGAYVKHKSELNQRHTVKQSTKEKTITLERKLKILIFKYKNSEIRNSPFDLYAT